VTGAFLLVAMRIQDDDKKGKDSHYRQNDQYWRMLAQLAH
jgi:hypothetical protein